MERILIIEPDASFREKLQSTLSGEGYAVHSGASAADAAQLGSRGQYDLVLTDLELSGGSGIDVLRWFAEHSPETPVAMMNCDGAGSRAAEALRLGAVDWLGKPLDGLEELRWRVRRILEWRATEREREVLRESESRRFAGGNFIARDPKMVELLELARRVAPASAAVLLVGPSGAGKHALARLIHRDSPRAGRVFVPFHCAALPPEVVESGLFGQEKDALDAAAGGRAGCIEQAHGGTLFLREIGELDANLQGKLLRVVRERTFERAGGTREIGADLRLITATRCDLRKLVTEGRFREDFYYRLNTFTLVIPPLRERPADIPPLAAFFLERAAGQLGKTGLTLSQDALDALLAYPWPGNVRELENVMERAAMLCDGEVASSELPIPRTGGSRPAAWKAIERKAIEEALRAHDGNRTHAARQLGISLRKLQYRLKEYESLD
jgi:two-component system, NtrC family, response regulator AtoC